MYFTHIHPCVSLSSFFSIKNPVVKNIRGSQFIKLDESTDVANLSRLMVLICYTIEIVISEEYLDGKPLHVTVNAYDAEYTIYDFSDDSNKSWESLVNISSDNGGVIKEEMLYVVQH